MPVFCSVAVSAWPFGDSDAPASEEVETTRVGTPPAEEAECSSYRARIAELEAQLSQASLPGRIFQQGVTGADWVRALLRMPSWSELQASAAAITDQVQAVVVPECEASHAWLTRAAARLQVVLAGRVGLDADLATIAAVAAVACLTALTAGALVYLVGSAAAVLIYLARCMPCRVACSKKRRLRTA